MYSLNIDALPVHTAATVLEAATSTSPIRAATTDVVEDGAARFARWYLALNMRPSFQRD